MEISHMSKHGETGEIFMLETNINFFIEFVLRSMLLMCLNSI